MGIVLSNSSFGQEQCSATVLNNEIRITFTLDEISENAVWSWNLTTTPDNSLEYQFLAHTTVDTNLYRFGYSLFKFPKSQQKSGSFHELMKSGQLNIWQGSGKTYSVIKEGKIVTNVVENKLIITVSDSETLNKLFSQKPTDIEFHIKTPEIKYKIQTGKLNYQNSR